MLSIFCIVLAAEHDIGSDNHSFNLCFHGTLPTISQQKKFTHKNEGFRCAYCRRAVPARRRGCRNHCPYCLSSKHVDVNPGDRAHSCQGQLKPIGYEYAGKKGISLIFRCASCGSISKNIAALDEGLCSDDFDQILQLPAMADPAVVSGLAMRQHSGKPSKAHT